MLTRAEMTKTFGRRIALVVTSLMTCAACNSANRGRTLSTAESTWLTGRPRSEGKADQTAGGSGVGGGVGGGAAVAVASGVAAAPVVVAAPVAARVAAVAAVVAAAVVSAEVGAKIERARFQGK